MPVLLPLKGLNPRTPKRPEIPGSGVLKKNDASSAVAKSKNVIWYVLSFEDADSPAVASPGGLKLDSIDQSEEDVPGTCLPSSAPNPVVAGGASVVAGAFDAVVEGAVAVNPGAVVGGDTTGDLLPHAAATRRRTAANAGSFPPLQMASI
jgi:hypothetical protein